MGAQLGNSVEFYVGPPVLGAPDDLDSVICGFIAKAKTELLVAVQELDSLTITTALLAAKKAKVRVRVILEGDYLVEPKPLPDPWTTGGDYEANRSIHSALLRAGVDVITDLNPAIFHQKFLVRDDGGNGAAVLTGSTNFTLTDTGTNPATNTVKVGNNLNHIVVLHGQRAVNQYRAEFDRLRSGTFGELHERHEPRPSEFQLAKIRIKPVFAPEQGPEMEIMKQMLKAKTSIDFVMFTFAQSSGIDDTMFRLVPSLTRLRGALDREQGAQAWAATQPLKQAGVQLFQNKPGTGVRKIHHKLMVIDERLVIAGSFNYTGPAGTLNDENILILGDLEETNPAAETAQRQLAAYALTEIERIITNLCEPV
jgi:phosphatidylserine/phosphatidylglycerophosphate/cardiolipin synthase-like enzyme